MPADSNFDITGILQKITDLQSENLKLQSQIEFLYSNLTKAKQTIYSYNCLHKQDALTLKLHTKLQNGLNQITTSSVASENLKDIHNQIYQVLMGLPCVREATLYLRTSAIDWEKKVDNGTGFTYTLSTYLNSPSPVKPTLDIDEYGCYPNIFDKLYAMKYCGMKKCYDTHIDNIYTFVHVTPKEPILGVFLHLVDNVTLTQLEMLEHFLACVGNFLGIVREFASVCRQYLTDTKRSQHIISNELDRDALTGIKNQNALTKYIDNCGAQPKIICFLDIDKFKFINDTYGHENGDVALKWFASIGVTTVKETGGEFFRNGGDEFIAIFKSSNILQACLTLENFQRKCKEKVFKFKSVILGHENETHDYSLSCSIGVYPDTQGLDYPSARVIADKAMYASKNNGRGCIHIAITDTLTGETRMDILDDKLKSTLIEKN